MDRIGSSRPNFKQAMKSLGFGAFLFFAGIHVENEIQLGEANTSHMMSTFLLLFGAFVIYTGLKELYQALK